MKRAIDYYGSNSVLHMLERAGSSARKPIFMYQQDAHSCVLRPSVEGLDVFVLDMLTSFAALGYTRRIGIPFIH